MNQLMPHALHLSAAATVSLVSAVWQGALLAAFVFAVLRLFPRLSAAARSIIWLNVFILMALLHVLPAFTAGRVTLPASSVHALRLDPRWSLAVAGVWMALSIARVVQLGLGALHLRRVAGRAAAVEAPASLKPLLAHRGRMVALCVSPDVARPSVLGFVRPRILLPPALLDELSETELRQVVLHEMEHLRRGDDWINLLQKIALVLFPLNPALAWVERRLCAERELACDDRVLHAGSGRKAYALCLTHLAEYALVKRSFSLVLGAWERRPELVRRVHRILSEPVRSMGRRPALAAMASVSSGALACTLVLAHAPQIVRFAPAVHIAGQTQAANMPSVSPGDVQELARELGGHAEMAKAVLPPRAHKPQVARRAVVRRPAHKTPPPARLAQLNPPPPSDPGVLIMTTAWTDPADRTRVVLTFRQLAPEPRVTQARPGQQPAQFAMPAAFAVLPTPDGWLVIQI